MSCQRTKCSWRTNGNFVRDQRGQDIVEYSLLMAFLCLAAAATYLATTQSISGLWTLSNQGLSAPLSTVGTGS